jgi:membrane protein required for colicin V production
MNGFDILLTILVGLLVLLGLVKGLTRLLFGIASLVAGFVLASQLHESLSARLYWLAEASDVRKLIAYLAIFIGTLLVGGLVAWLVRAVIKAAMLSWADRLAGAAVGFAAAVLLTAWIVLPLVAYAPAGERVLRDSVLAPYVTVVADAAKNLVPPGLSERYDDRMEDLRRYWRARWDTVPPPREACRWVPGRTA